MLTMKISLRMKTNKKTRKVFFEKKFPHFLVNFRLMNEGEQGKTPQSGRNLSWISIAGLTYFSVGMNCKKNSFCEV